MRLVAVGVCVAMVALAASDAWSQDNPVLPGAQLPATAPATTGVAPAQAPVGHRQPTPKDLPPDVASGQQPAEVGRGEQQTEGAASRGYNARGRGGGPPTLQVGSSCEAAGRGSVVLGRDKKACLADESTAQDTLRQVQILRNRQDSMHRHGEDRRPGELCRAVVLPRDHAGRAQHSEIRHARERHRRDRRASPQSQIGAVAASARPRRSKTPSCATSRSIHFRVASDSTASSASGSEAPDRHIEDIRRHRAPFLAIGQMV
jgi:hypothetical protein